MKGKYVFWNPYHIHYFTIYWFLINKVKISYIRNIPVYGHKIYDSKAYSLKKQKNYKCCVLSLKITHTQHQIIVLLWRLVMLLKKKWSYSKELNNLKNFISCNHHHISVLSRIVYAILQHIYKLSYRMVLRNWSDYTFAL